MVTAVEDQLVPHPARVTETVPPTTGPAGALSSPLNLTGVPKVPAAEVCAVSVVAVRTVVARDVLPCRWMPFAATVAV